MSAPHHPDPYAALARVNRAVRELAEHAKRSKDDFTRMATHEIMEGLADFRHAMVALGERPGSVARQRGAYAGGDTTGASGNGAVRRA